VSDLLEKRHELKSNLLVLTEKKKVIDSKLHDLAAGRAPLLLVQEELKKLTQLVNNSEKFTPKTLPLLINEQKLLIRKLKNSNLIELDIKTVQSIFDSRVTEIKAEIDSNVMININQTNIPSFEDLVILQKEISIFNVELSVINEKIDSANRMLEAVPSEDKVRSILEQLKSKEKDLGHEKGRLEFLNSELKEIEIEQEKIQKIIRAKLDEISAELTKKHLDDRILNHAKRSRHTLETFKVKLLDSHLSRVGEEITNCFRLLHRKNKFLLKFEIDSSDYSLKIIKPDNSTITAKSLSAGERQLLAVSILWALAKCSGKKLPTVIDTPLGRLDGPHREKVVNNYFPKASDQVLIFSTDSEITNDFYLNLKKYISSEYSINYDEDSESSSITKGYFKHMVNT
jgi:DNA sulfur modification protein DndD